MAVLGLRHGVKRQDNCGGLRGPSEMSDRSSPPDAWRDAVAYLLFRHTQEDLGRRPKDEIRDRRLAWLLGIHGAPRIANRHGSYRFGHLLSRSIANHFKNQAPIKGLRTRTRLCSCPLFSVGRCGRIRSRPPCVLLLGDRAGDRKPTATERKNRAWLWQAHQNRQISRPSAEGTSESWLRESEQSVEWIFCLTAARVLVANQEQG
jgi:hypothetical protein